MQTSLRLLVTEQGEMCGAERLDLDEVIRSMSGRAILTGLDIFEFLEGGASSGELQSTVLLDLRLRVTLLDVGGEAVLREEFGDGVCGVVLRSSASE